ncbi:MAG: DUF421 domain-containing protein [Tuberibacillus sp.]
MVMTTVIVRTLFLYIIILLTFRIMGKREIGQLSIVDFVVSIMIAEIAVISIEDPNKPLMVTIVPIAILMLVQYGLAYMSLKSQGLRQIVDGQPITIIKNGRVDEEVMRKQRYNFDDLLMQLREKNVKSIQDVEFAILEPNGDLSVFKKANETFGDRTNKHFPIPLIIDGKIQEENIEAIDKTPFWLRQELRKLGFRDIKNISYCVLDHNGAFFVDQRERN